MWPWTRRRNPEPPRWSPPDRIPDGDTVPIPGYGRWADLLGDNAATDHSGWPPARRRRAPAMSRLHSPRRPEWTCQTCDQPYPCGTARQGLLARYGPGRQLAERLSDMLHQAVSDRPDASIVELYDRIVRWAVPGRR